MNKKKIYPIALSLFALLFYFSSSIVSAEPNLTWDEAQARSAVVSNISYQLNLHFKEQSPTYDGSVVITFSLMQVPDTLHLDFQGKTLSQLSINSKKLAVKALENHRIELDRSLLKTGENEVRISYVNLFDTDGAGLHKFTDTADGNEYIFSQFEPYKANRMFPCFDQPDLKATYQLTVDAPESWQVISNTLAKVSSRPNQRRHEFGKTQLFSTYLVALMAGPYQVWEDSKARIPSRIFATRSMASYVDT